MHFIQPDTLIPDIYNPQSLNRFSYVNNNPIRYSDPSGHQLWEGEGSITNQTIQDDLKRDAEFKSETKRNKCKAGDQRYCSYAENHPVETFTFITTALVGGPIVEDFILGGGLAGAADWAFWRAGVSCLSNSICAALIGAGGAGTANTTTTTSQNLGSSPDSGVTVLGYTEDLAYYEGVEVNMLQNVPNYTWEGTNVPFIEQAMARGDTIVLISDFAQHPERSFPREVLYLLTTNYKNIIDMFRPR